MLRAPSSRDVGVVAWLRAARLLLATACAWMVLASAASGRAQRPLEVLLRATELQPAVGTPFEVQIDVTIRGGDGGEIVPLELRGLTVLGQRQGMSQQFVLGGPGGPTREQRITTVYTVVAPGPGVYSVGPAEFRTPSGVVRSAALVIKVDGVGGTAPAPTPQAIAPAADEMVFDPDGFVRVLTDVEAPYVGQQVTYTVYLYLPAREHAQVQQQRAPQTTGFWSQPMPHRTDAFTIETVQGRPFEVYVLDRQALFALRPGPQRIEGPVLTVTPRGAFWGPPPTPRQITGGTVELTVRPLPAGTSPRAFVGRAEVRAELDRPNARTGEAVTLTVNLRGEGSARDVTLPPLSVDGLQFEPATIEDRVDVPTDRLVSERVFRVSAIVLRPGRFTIPPLEFPVFDPATGASDVLRTSAIGFEAVGAPVVAEPIDAGVPADQADEAPQADPEARFGAHARSASMRRAGPPVHGRRWFLPAVLLPLALPLVVFAGRRAAASWSRFRARRTTGARRPTLADARRALGRDDAAGFHASLSRVLYDALDHAFDLRTFGMTHAELRRTLRTHGVDEDLVSRVLDELEAADFARFSASAGTADEMRRSLERVGVLLDRITSTRRGAA